MKNKQIHTIDPLFDFQILCDTDLGLYRLIKRDYYDRSVFDNTLFDSRDERFIRTILMCRDHFNPLSVFCKKNIMKDEELDDLYEQFLTEEYDNILKLSTSTSIMELASIASSVNKIINITVICNSEKEKQWIEKQDPRLKCIIAEYKDFDIKSYDTIYLKNIYTLLAFKQESIDLKNILIAKSIFNLEIATNNIELPIIEVSQKYHKKNKIMLIDVYNDISIPSTEMV